MIKKILLTGALLFCLTGCVAQKPISGVAETTQEPNTEEKTIQKETTVEEPATDEADEKLNLMQQVLLNQAEFIDVRYAGNTLAISELGGVSSYAYFYYMDLDGDGSYEVIVEGYPESDASIFSIIDEKVYRYDYSSRCDLYTDGTISSSGGASISYFSRITDFTPKGYVDDYIAIYDGSVWAEHPNTTYYTDFVDGHYTNEITEEEYNNIMSQYERIPAEKYDFTRENIEKIVTEEPVTDKPDENLNLMQQVLLNQAEFKHILIIGGKVCTNTRTISELDNYDSEYGHSFYYKDLDEDGSYEVCVSGIPYANITIFSVIDGEIYAFEYPGRGMAPLYTDGTMGGASSATDWGLSRIVDFTKEGIVEENIVLIDGDINGVEPDRYYTDFVDGHYTNEITEEEYNNIMSQYECIPAEEYDFTRENIEKIVME